jgi:hypothetical protein
MTDLGLEEPPQDVVVQILLEQANDLIQFHNHINSSLQNRIEELTKERESTKVLLFKIRINK